MYSTGTHGQENSHNVSFSARIGNDRPIAVGQTIPFDDVLNNDGNAYSPLTGIFTTPVAGKYLFSCTITMRGNEIMDASLMKNDDDIGKLWTFKYQNNNADATSITVVVNLDQGDTVYVKFTSGDGNSIQHAGYTYFSGVLILS